MVFNPIAATYRNKTLKSCYRRLEAGKRREYQDRILNVEHGSFSPLIYTTAGGIWVLLHLLSFKDKPLSSLSNEMNTTAKLSFSSDVRLVSPYYAQQQYVVFAVQDQHLLLTYIANTCMDLALTEGRVSY